MQLVDVLGWEADDRWKVVYPLVCFHLRGWHFVLDDLIHHNHDHVHPVLGEHAMLSLPLLQRFYLCR